MIRKDGEITFPEDLSLVIAMELKQRIAERTPVLTGKLLSSLEISGQGGISSVGFTAEHAPYVEGGTVHQRPQLMVQNSLEEVPEILNKVLK
jgi:hypothetical protein